MQKTTWHLDEAGCWIWQGVPSSTGYGTVGINRHTYLAHRVYYERYIGPIPKGLHLDHLCRVLLCVNPLHLEAVTPRVNALRNLSPNAINARKTHCLRGHPLSGDNVYHRPDNPSRRNCVACQRQRDRGRKRNSGQHYHRTRASRSRRCTGSV